MRTWRTAFREAVQENPKLSATLAFELGLLLFAALKARYGRPSSMPSSAELIEAVPVLALAALSAKPKLSRKRASRARGRRRSAGTHH
jgi:hypothetical protein